MRGKHIKKVFLGEKKFDKKKIEVLEPEGKAKSFTLPESNNISKKDKKEFDTEAIFIDDRLIKDLVRYGNKRLPIPSFTHVYFNCAYMLQHHIKDSKNGAVAVFKENGKGKPIGHPLYNYVGLLSSCVINLQASIEAFLNMKIPNEINDGTYTAKNGVKKIRNREFYLGVDIKNKIKLIEKIYNVYKNDEYRNLRSRVKNLIDLRNNLIHLNSSEGFAKEKKLFNQLLSYDYSEAIQNVRDFINTIEPGCIEDCNCGNEDSDFIV